MRILKWLWRENVARKINCCGCAVLPSLKSSLFNYKILTEKILGTVFSWMYLGWILERNVIIVISNINVSQIPKYIISRLYFRQIIYNCAKLQLLSWFNAFTPPFMLIFTSRNSTRIMHAENMQEVKQENVSKNWNIFKHADWKWKI